MTLCREPATGVGLQPSMMEINSSSSGRRMLSYGSACALSSISWRYSTPLRRILIISLFTIISPLRMKSSRFSNRWANLLMFIRPKKPEFPFRLWTGRKILLMISMFSGSFSSSMKAPSMPSIESWDSSIKPSRPSMSRLFSSVIFFLFLNQPFEDGIDPVEFGCNLVNGF